MGDYSPPLFFVNYAKIRRDETGAGAHQNGHTPPRFLKVPQAGVRATAAHPAPIREPFPPHACPAKGVLIAPKARWADRLMASEPEQRTGPHGVVARFRLCKKLLVPTVTPKINLPKAFTMAKDAGPDRFRQSIPRHHQREVRKKCAGFCAADLGDRGFIPRKRSVRFLPPATDGGRYSGWEGSRRG